MRQNQYNNRLHYPAYFDKICSAEKAALLIDNKNVVGVSGFTKAGDSKAVLPAFAARAAKENLQITLISGASLGYNIDGLLAKNKALIKRMPFQMDKELRDSINSGKVLYIDQHLSQTAEFLAKKQLPPVDIAIIEASKIDKNGYIVPTTSVGNSTTLAKMANKIIIEINTFFPDNLESIFDIYSPPETNEPRPIDITTPESKIGNNFIPLDPQKVMAIVFTNHPDEPANVKEPDQKPFRIADHLLNFLKSEVKKDRLPIQLKPIQVGIGKIANAVLSRFMESSFADLTMYSEVLQDSTFELMDAGKLSYASATSITLSKDYRTKFFKNFDQYKDKIILRPQNISNSPEIIRRLEIISINTAIEIDIYGNVNSSHIGGNKIMNGIGGSGDFARNALLSIFVCPSTSKNHTLSHIVPMVTHVDNTEHDVDIIVTEVGLADLRGLAPRERATCIINHCIHPVYKDQMLQYYQEALQNGGHTPHLLSKAFSWHIHYHEKGTMLFS